MAGFAGQLLIPFPTMRYLNKHKSTPVFTGIILLTWVVGMSGASPAPLPKSTPWDLEKLFHAPAFEWQETNSKVRALHYKAEPWKGKPTRTFAYYASPRDFGAKETKFPGIVLVHGGGGAAFDKWVKIWAERGYAAIAMDNALLYRSLEGKASELAQLKAYNEEVVESITVGVVAIDPEGEITVWNNAMVAIFGLESSDVVGSDVSDVFPDDLVQALKRGIEGPKWVAESASRFYKTHVEMKKGQSRLVNITLSPFVLQEDVVTGILMVFDDVTEKGQLENQLLQAEKLSSIGLLAAGIAHEINTPLTGVCSYTQMLVKETPSSDPRHEVLKKIERQGFRASTIVDNLLNFARVSDIEFSEVNVNGLMLETLSLIDHQLRKSDVEVEVDLDASLPATLANGGKLQQVFMNLILNARDAMPQGGKLTVRTYQEDSQLVVKIQDSGTGISDENVQRIYDPFFTTKKAGEGSGLGLSVSYGIIREHSGRINVDSTSGQGTTFRLHLPVKRVN